MIGCFFRDHSLKRSLVDIALEQIRQRIDAGHWPLGQRLPPEPELAELLGMSRNTVREAVRVLTFSGVLEVRQGDGTTCAPAPIRWKPCWCWRAARCSTPWRHAG